jgi:hypothetical protein
MRANQAIKRLEGLSAALNGLLEPIDPESTDKAPNKAWKSVGDSRLSRARNKVIGKFSEGPGRIGEKSRRASTMY